MGVMDGIWVKFWIEFVVEGKKNNKKIAVMGFKDADMNSCDEIRLCDQIRPWRKFDEFFHNPNFLSENM